MAKENVSLFTKMKNKVKDYIGEREGVSGNEEQALIRDPKPYASYTTSGIFNGYDDSVWLYFKMPEDVQVYWTKTEDEKLENQYFLTAIFDSLGKSMISSTSSKNSTKNDYRIRYHIAGIREQTNVIHIPGVITPAQQDYIDRMGGWNHSEWHFYLGLELQQGSIFEDVYGIKEQAKHYIDFLRNRDGMHFQLYKESISLYNSVCLDNGMQPLDFYAHPEDFERLTAWFGQDDKYYGVKRELQTTPLFVPDSGMSIFANHREMSFHSISPIETSDIFAVDPKNESQVEFGRELFSPVNRVIHINIRGEIRTPTAAANVFGDKLIETEYTGQSEKYDDPANLQEKNRMETKAEKYALTQAMALNLNTAFLDNTEITVATIVDGKPQTLDENLRPYNMKSTNILHRQHIALCSTVPCYPNPIFRISKRNGVKNPNVNSFFAGILSASGLFRSTRYSAESGILLGLSAEGHEYKAIMTDPDDSLKYGSPPIVLLTGDSGSGKTVMMLNMICQTVYLGKLAIMINPKATSSARGVFDLLDGITIKMSSEYMRKHPGQLDPLFYINDREQAGRVLADMIISGMKYNYSQGDDAVKNAIAVENLTAEIMERAKMKANECSWDIIAGNKRVKPPTPKLSNDGVIEFVQSKMKTSAFWKASISRDPEGRSAFKNSINSGRPILIEWDGSINLPDKEQTPDKYTPPQQDGIQSVLNVFTYATEILGNSRQGGILAIDEAHHLKRSPTIMNKLTTSGREWRSSGITLMLATQEVLDFLDPDDVDISAYVRLFIFMHIAPENRKNVERFLDIISMEDRTKLEAFITNAKPSARSVYPGAYVRDKTTKWEGGIICGPFPTREMNAIESGTKNARINTTDEDRKELIESNITTDDQLWDEINQE